MGGIFDDGIDAEEMGLILAVADELEEELTVDKLNETEIQTSDDTSRVDESFSDESERIEIDHCKYLEADHDDYDSDYDVPPDYMDDCPEDTDPEIWREYYTGG